LCLEGLLAQLADTLGHRHGNTSYVSYKIITGKL
jgi:hypothetical protein